MIRPAHRPILAAAVSMLALTTAEANEIVGTPHVVRGDATVSVTGNTTIVNQTSGKAVLNWSGLSVPDGTTLRFDQPDVNSITLNRITGGGVSNIDGMISANGQVWVLNRSGVLIGAGGRVQTAGFLATTRSIADDDFMAGRYNFRGQGGGEIANAGQIVADGGYAVLAGGKISNSGLISARLGTLALLGGQGFSLDLVGDKLLSFAITEPLALVASDGVINNSGRIAADGGRVILTVRGAADAAASVINSAGLVQAQSVQLHNGEIILDAGDAAITISGKLDASGLGANETAGGIGVSAQSILVSEGARLDARGELGGGTIHVGGGLHGVMTGGRAPAIYATVARGASLDASAVTRGNGGVISLWSDIHNPLSVTRASGDFRANGGYLGGDGGIIETSGRTLRIDGVTGSASAARGLAGEWLFDPYDVQIVAALDGQDSSQLLASDLVGVLDSGTNVTVDTANPPQAGAGGEGEGNITLNTSLTKTSGEAATLTLRAHNDIVIQPGANIASTGGGLNVVLTADSDDDGAGTIYLGGNITTSGGQSNGLVGIRYDGYFNDNFGFFDYASVRADPRFDDNLFTSINTTTPGANFDDNYSVRFFGFFQPTVSGSHNFRTTSDDASYLFIGKPGETVASLEARAGSAIVVANGGAHGADVRAGDIDLTAGNLYPILVYFGEAGGGDEITVDFTPPGGALTQDGTGYYFTSVGGQATLNGNVQLIRNVTINAQGSVSFNGTVDSATTFPGISPADHYGLAVTNPMGSINFAQDVGSTNALAHLTTQSKNVSTRSVTVAGGGQIRLDVAQAGTVTGTLSANRLTKSGAGKLDWTTSTTGMDVDALYLDGGTLNLTGDSLAELSVPISLTADSILSFQTGTVDLSSSINGAYDLDIVSDGALTVNGAIGLTNRLARLRIASLDILTLGADSALRTSGDIRLAAGQRFVNNATSGNVLDSLGGTWRVFSDNHTPFDGDAPDDSGSLSHDFRSYGIKLSETSNLAGFDAFDANPLVPAQGNGYLYSLAPTVSITGTVSREYDGTTIVDLPNVILAGSGAVNGDTIVTGAASGSFDSANVGARTVQLDGISLVAQDSAGKPVYGYRAGEGGELTGMITPRTLTASLTGPILRTYDGTTSAILSASNYQLSGLVIGESFDVVQQTGAYASPNAGTGITVSAELAADDFTVGPNTAASNYALPTTASGAIGTILPKPLTAVLTGTTSRSYTGTFAATLSSSNYQLSGFLNGQSITVNQASGRYADQNVGTGIGVSANLGTNNFAPGAGTLLGNYELPASASGAIGEITPATLRYVATPVSRSVGTPNPAFGGTVSGLVANETIPDVTTGTLTFSSDAGTQSAPNSYAITGLGLSARNYIFEQAPGNATALTVTAVPLPPPPPPVVVEPPPAPPPPPPVMEPPPPPPPPPVVEPPPAPPPPVVEPPPAPPPPPPPPVVESPPTPPVVEEAARSVVSTVSSITVPTPPTPAVSTPSATPAPAPAPAPSSASASSDSGSSSSSGDSSSGGSEPAPSESSSSSSDSSSSSSDTAAASSEGGAAPSPASDGGGDAPASSSAAPAAPASAAPAASSGSGGGSGSEVAVVTVAPAPVDALAPSPVPGTPPPTPTDAADAGDPILQAAAPDAPPAPAGQVQRTTVMLTQLNPNIAVSVDLPPRAQGAPGVDVRFSLSGDFGS